VSCWCCSNKNLKELKNIYIHLPAYWEKLRQLQAKTARPMKGYYKDEPKGVFEMEERFKREIEAAKEVKPDGT
jgi:predicted RNA-binding protein